MLALIVASILFLAARAQRAQTGLPIHARVVFCDTGAWRAVERPLFSRAHQLTGKPDYIVEENGALIPVEVKPNRVASAPRESDVMQLAAYGLLIAENYGAMPAYGLLKYRDTVFRVEFTDAVRNQLFDVMDAMRQDLEMDDIAPSHADPRRCRACGYRDACGQAIGDAEI